MLWHTEMYITQKEPRNCRDTKKENISEVYQFELYIFKQFYGNNSYYENITHKKELRTNWR